jgi:hypothetical protein
VCTKGEVKGEVEGLRTNEIGTIDMYGVHREYAIYFVFGFYHKSIYDAPLWYMMV